MYQITHVVITQSMIQEEDAIMLTNRQINSKVEMINKLQAQIDAQAAQVEELKSQLKAELTERGVNSIATNKHMLAYSSYNRRNVDSNKLKEAGLYDKFSKVSVITSFKITDIKTV